MSRIKRTDCLEAAAAIERVREAYPTLPRAQAAYLSGFAEGLRAAAVGPLPLTGDALEGVARMLSARRPSGRAD